MKYAISLLTLIVVGLTSVSGHARVGPDSFADLIEKLSPAVVNISTTQKVKQPGVQFKFHGLPEGEGMEPFREFFERFGEQFNGGGAERDVTSLGSGFVIDPSGYIVTNNHVVAEADEVTVTFQDDSKHEATIVGRDSKTDLALLKIETKKKLPHVEFGDSDEARVGDWVIAIGNPFGLGGSVSVGIVSARSRDINAGPFDDFIQTDAAINRGNSGGPLFNADGEVIGVNSAIFSPGGSGGNVGIGFSIPAALAKPVLQQLKEYGRTHRGWLGVKIQHVTDEIADSLGMRKARGALVLEVNEGSPADKGGVKAGDVIVQFDNKPVKEMRSLPRLVAETKAGKKVDVVVLRNDREKDLTITLGEMDESEDEVAVKTGGKVKPKAEKAEEYMGFSLVPLNKAAREKYGIEDDVNGLMVIDVKGDTPAGESGLRGFDIIVQANQKDVKTVDDFKAAIKQARKEGKDNALLRVMRGSAVLFLTVKTKEED